MALLELVLLVRRPRRLAAWSLALAIAPLAAACDDDTPSGEPPSDFCGMSCDDKEPCTEDRCDLESGQCVHIPRDAANACTMDRHCDDGDPCTTDACATDACGFDRCHHELVPGCRSCVNNLPCDDGNPCTSDTCGADFMCTYVSEPFCDSHCTTWFVTNLGSVPVGPVTVLGRAEPRGGASCVTGCECEHDLILTNDSASITLDGDAEAAPWSCSVATCSAPAAIACDPLERGREYVVWGLAGADRDAAGAAPQADVPAFVDVGVPVEMATRLTAEGYCMAPTTQGVFGAYAATLAVDGESPRSFQAEVDLLAGPQFHIQPSDGILDQQAGFSLDGVSLVLWFTAGGRALTAQLFPSTDRLQGPVFDPNQASEDAKPAFPGDVPEPPQGFGKRVGTMTLVLER